MHSAPKVNFTIQPFMAESSQRSVDQLKAFVVTNLEVCSQAFCLVFFSEPVHPFFGRLFFRSHLNVMKHSWLQRAPPVKQTVTRTPVSPLPETRILESHGPAPVPTLCGAAGRIAPKRLAELMAFTFYSLPLLFWFRGTERPDFRKTSQHSCSKSQMWRVVWCLSVRSTQVTLPFWKICLICIGYQQYHIRCFSLKKTPALCLNTMQGPPLSSLST